MMKTINLISIGEWSNKGFQERFTTLMRQIYDYTIVVNIPCVGEAQEHAKYAVLNGVTDLHDLIDRRLLLGENIHLVLNTPSLIHHLDHPDGSAQTSDYSVPIRVTSDTVRAASYKVGAVTFIHALEQ